MNQSQINYLIHGNIIPGLFSLGTESNSLDLLKARQAETLKLVFCYIA